jgi:hypothetical protein
VVLGFLLWQRQEQPEASAPQSAAVLQPREDVPAESQQLLEAQPASPPEVEPPRSAQRAWLPEA